MKRGHLPGLLSTLVISPISIAAIIRVEGPDGESEIFLSPFEEMDVRLVIEVQEDDSIPIYFVNAFLNADANHVVVKGLVAGQRWTYDRSAFDLPANIDGTNEYGLIAGDQDGVNGIEAQPGVYVLDTLTLLNDGTSFGELEITIEIGARAPQIFGKAPEYIPYPVVPPGFPPGLGNWLYIGDQASNNSPFLIHFLIDCNGNNLPDADDIATGLSGDCDFNGIPDECDIADGKYPDCNGNSSPDFCDLDDGTSKDLNDNSVPDECDPDCQGNGRPDFIDIVFGISDDCNDNDIPDECESQADCDQNGGPDECDLADGAPDDDGDGVLDFCECPGDVNGDGIRDPIDVGLITQSFGLDDFLSLAVFDMNRDGEIDPLDSGFVMSRFGLCPE